MPWRASWTARGARCPPSSRWPITPACAWAQSGCGHAHDQPHEERRPDHAGLSSAALAELKRLPKVGQDELLFGNRDGKPYTYRPLWRRIAKEARLEGRVFHELRHGHGYQLARAGVSQQLIMASMGHKTLTASARYAHVSVADKKAVIAKVFG